ncbi:MAG: UDP-N-acetylmuramate:L-alanyl-gamma-D-glutamyl-meso-diaminopimelate ligase [Arenicella sp.]|nr:UDP-N-acetylmuramate:L-alanyl-gamma-D-glutamyl-meso-diaminopimelate ligase [Arenicella sp.]
MNVYIIGICGTFMGGLARLARDMGMSVSGSDANTYPPMSTQLESLGIELYEGYRADNVVDEADIVLVGNTISRGNPELEYVLNRGMRYCSGAQWLSENVLQGRWVLAVAGTHGKTTTASMLAWILHANQLEPGYLIGGVPANFNQSACLGREPFFVIEADEYDTAFCDKRSKFLHYKPRTLILNNLEFDHADIFADLGAIQTQFHHLIKTIPGDGLIIHNAHSPALDQVLQMGCWTTTSGFAIDNNDSPRSVWQCKKLADDASVYEIVHGDDDYIVKWDLIGDHNMFNGVAAIAAAHHAGVTVAHAVEALASFKSVKRRLEKIFDDGQIRIYDDFAHHPTAISETLNGLRSSVGNDPVIAVLEPRSNTMKRGVHKHLLADALRAADQVLIFADDNVLWDIDELSDDRISTFRDTGDLLRHLLKQLPPENAKTNVLIMSNGGFEDIQQRLIAKLNQR